MIRLRFVFGVLVILGARLAGGEAEYAPNIAKASAEAENAIKNIRLLQGLKAEVFAAEPMLANPVAIEIDGRGRVYVVETFRHGVGVDTASCGLNVEQDLALRTVDERVEFMKLKSS